MLRSKSWSKHKEGCTILYITEIEDTYPDYTKILQHIQDNIEIPEDYDGALQAETA